MTAVFWCSFALLVYVYAGYPALAWLLARLFGREPAKQPITPMVSLLIPAFNEEAHLEHKLRNSLALDYPKQRLEIVVASDGSTDQTDAIAGRFASQGARLVVMPRNIGKSAMLGRVVPQLVGEIVVFSDASSELASDSVRSIVANFADAQVGCVSGLYRLHHPQDVRGEGEGLYWRYETWIKRQESRLHSILGAHGAFYGIRRRLFHPPGDASINDDYLIPMRIVEQGYRAVYEPAAVSCEREVASVEGEFARRVRIAMGNCQQIVALPGLLLPTRGWVALCFVSHKILRTLAPLALLSMAAGSFTLAWPLSGVALSLQALLYGSAWFGYVCQQRGLRIAWFSPPLYFCFGNLAMLVGLIRFCFGGRKPAWASRRPAANAQG